MSSPSSTSSSRRTLAWAGGLVLALQALLLATGGSTAFFHSELVTWQYERARELDAEAGVGLLAVGNSQLHVGFDAALFTERTGVESFNFGLDGADAVVQARFLRRVLVPTLRPTQVLWALSPRDLNANPKFFDHTNHERILESPALRLASLPGGWRLLPFAKDLLPFHKRTWRDWCAVAFRAWTDKPHTLDARGFRARPGLYEPGPFRQAQSGFYYEALTDPAWLTELEETAAWIRAQGAGLRVATLPVHANTAGMFHPERLAEGRRQIARIAASAGAPHLDWFEAASFANASLYRDAIHLNPDGAARLTERLAAEYGAPEGGSAVAAR